ncbi:MATE family efflux transporter [Halosegnis marinus]|uniref:MATE family efflux transporter n=1 Tax=Halosegnis marinus TaxID=3034023 RepID=UPI0036071D13
MLAFLFIDPVVGFLAGLESGGGGVNVEESATTYLRVIFLGLSLAVVSDVLEMVYIGHGDSKTSLYMNVVPVLVNVTLDPLLIFGYGPFPRLEVQGAALATVTSWGAGLLFGLVVLRTSRGTGLFSRAQARLDRATMRDLLDTGAPIAGQNLARQVARFAMVVVAFLAGGGAGVAAYYLGARVAGVSFVPAGGLKNALQSVVGQNIGAERADRADRATRVAFAIAVGLLTVVGVVQLLVPGAVVDLLAPTLDGTARGFAVDYLTILAYGYPAIGAAYMLEGGSTAPGARRCRSSPPCCSSTRFGSPSGSAARCCSTSACRRCSGASPSRTSSSPSASARTTSAR